MLTIKYIKESHVSVSELENDLKLWWKRAGDVLNFLEKGTIDFKNDNAFAVVLVEKCPLLLSWVSPIPDFIGNHPYYPKFKRNVDNMSIDEIAERLEKMTVSGRVRFPCLYHVRFGRVIFNRFGYVVFDFRCGYSGLGTRPVIPPEKVQEVRCPFCGIYSKMIYNKTKKKVEYVY